MGQLLSGKVKVTRPQDVSLDRYEYLSLSEAEPNLGIPESGSIDSGSFALVASDDAGNRLFVTKIQLEEFSGSFSGSFQGDGSQLTNLPLVEDASRLISGSASASISPQTGFLVNTSGSFDGGLTVDGNGRFTGDLVVDNKIIAREILVEFISSSIFFSSGSNKFGDELTDRQEFTGSVEITGSLTTEGVVEIPFDSAGFFSGSGEGLSNIPRSALTEDAQVSSRITSGSVTASVSPDFGFRLEGANKAEFSSSIFVENGVSASVFSGSGAGLFDIPRSALTEDALVTNQITSGSVTASVSPDFGFVVVSEDSGSQITGSIKVSGSITLAEGATYSGSGADLFNIPLSALATETLIATSLESGSVTASVSPDTGFKVESLESGSQFTGSLKISGSVTLAEGGIYSGSGAGLFDIPRSALTEDAQETSRITSGSVTASVDPNIGFKVESLESGSQITGSVKISGSITLAEGESYSGSGANLFDIPLSALATETLIATSLESGSVSASVSPDTGFKVESLESGSQFTGSLFVSGGVTLEDGIFTGDGSGLFNIPISNLAGDSPRIASGSATASVDPDGGFKFFGADRAEFSSSLFVSESIEAREFSGSFSGSGANLFDIPESALSFEISKITSGSVTASVDAEDGFVVTSIDSGSTFFGEVRVESGSSYSGSGAKLFDIPVAAIVDLDTSLIFSGSITASTNPEDGFVVTSIESGSTFFGDVKLSSGSVFSGSGRDLFDIPRSALTEDALLSSFIASGSVTASVSPVFGFRLEGTNRAEFSSSVFVESGVSASVFSGSGAGLTDIPESALAFDINKISSGSATASISPNEGFVVNTFSTFEFPVSASMFSGSGAGLFDIPQSALTEEAFRIASGSATASVSPNLGFVVNTSSLFEQDVRIDSDLVVTGRITTNELYTNFISSSIVYSSGSNIFGDSAEDKQTLIGETEIVGNVTASGIISSSFEGDGSRLFNIPLNALSEEAFRIASGSVSASLLYKSGSDEPSIFRVEDTTRKEIRTELSGSLGVSGSLSASMFSGSGEGLFDIPRSALAPDALLSNLIATGSITASLNPDGGMNVNTFTTITGGLFVKAEQTPGEAEVSLIELGDSTRISGSVFISSSITASLFQGDGSGLFNIPAAQLSGDSPRIASGSATASVSPNLGLQVNVPATFDASISASTTVFAKDVEVADDVTADRFIGNEVSGAFSGSGRDLFDIPRSALTEDALLTNNITSGSITASVIVVPPESGSNIFRVEDSTGTTKSEFSGSVFVSESITSKFFIGDGSQLTNVQAEESPIIASGSATASVESGEFFIVNAGSGSQFTSSIDITGSVVISNDLTASKINVDELDATIITSEEFTGSFSGSFAGDGSQLNNIPFTSLSGDAPRIGSGSVTASTDPDRGFVVESLDSGSLFTGSLFVSGNVQINDGIFKGDGAGLFNIPQSALAEDSPRIASGSVTASISPNFGFVVNTSGSIEGDLTIDNDLYVSGAINARELNVTFIDSVVITSSGSNTFGNNLDNRQEFTGSVFVTNSLDVDGVITGDGSGLFNIPQSALTEEAFRIASGSVSASVSPDRGFFVESSESGSELTGSVRISGSLDVNEGFKVGTDITASEGTVSASFFVGDGSQLTNLPAAEFAEEAKRIASGSATASISPNLGFVVNTTTNLEDDVRITGSFIVSSSNGFVDTGSLNTSFTITNDGANSYRFSGVDGDNPTITIVRGLTYTFNVNAPAHPFYIKTQNSDGTGFEYSGSVITNNGVDNDTITWVVSGSAPDTLYYNCENHLAMGGEFNIVDEIPLYGQIDLIGDTEVVGNLNITGSTFVTGNLDVSNTITANEISASKFLGDFSGSFSGSGRDLFNIPLSALAEDVLPRSFIASGSVTASVSPNKGFEVNSIAAITGGLFIDGETQASGAFLVSASYEPFVDDTTLVVEVQSADGGNKYFIDDEQQPKLEFLVGSTYTIWQSGSSNDTHDLRFSTTLDGTHNGGSVYTGSVDTGSIAAGNSGSRVIIDVTSDTPTTLYYYCINHTGMGGIAKVYSEEPSNANIVFDGRTDLKDNVRVEADLKVTQTITTLDANVTNDLNVTDTTTTEKLVANHITASSITASYLDFINFDEDNPSIPGRLKWNETDGTLDLGMKGGLATQQIGQELYYPPVINKDGGDLLNGTLVMIDPTQPAQGNRLRVVKAETSGSYAENYLVGIITETIPNNNEGFATWFGYVRDINTTTLQNANLKDSSQTWSEGDILYGDPLRPGGLTNVTPVAPNLKSTIAAVTAVNGVNVTLLVRPHLGDHLYDLHDVEITTNDAILVDSGSIKSNDGDLLVWQSGSQRWENTREDLELSGSFSGSFQGDGSQLTNISLANLSFDVNRLVTGSVTASVTNDGFFRVESTSSVTTELSGSLKVSESIDFGGVITGDGSGLTNISLANLAFDVNQIVTGSVTASTKEDGRFIVEDTAGGVKSEFSGSVEISQSLNVGGVISGDGSGLTNISIANLAFDADRIATGSVTASDDESGLFQLSSTGSVKSEFSGSVFISESISASFFEGDGGGLFNIPAEALQDLELDKIVSGSGEAVIDPNKLLVNVPLTASRFDGDGSGLFNIPAESLTDLELSLITSGSTFAQVSDNKGFVVFAPESGSQLTGSLFVSGAISLISGSSFSGSGRDLFDIPADAIFDLDQTRITSGSVTASVSPVQGFVVNTSASIEGDLTVENNIITTDITASIFRGGLFSGSFEGPYRGEGDAEDRDILIFDEDANKFVPVPESTPTTTEPFSNVTEVTIVHNFDVAYPIVQVYETGSNGMIIPLAIESIDNNTVKVKFSGLTSGQIVVGSGGSKISGAISGDNVIGTVDSASYAIFAETAGTASSVAGLDSASLAALQDLENFVRNEQTASMTVLSSSFAITASYAENAEVSVDLSEYIQNSQTSSMSVATSSF